MSKATKKIPQPRLSVSILEGIAEELDRTLDPVLQLLPELRRLTEYNVNCVDDPTAGRNTTKQYALEQAILAAMPTTQEGAISQLVVAYGELSVAVAGCANDAQTAAALVRSMDAMEVALRRLPLSVDAIYLFSIQHVPGKTASHEHDLPEEMRSFLHQKRHLEPENLETSNAGRVAS